jgi:hypothetical protein
MSQLTLKPFKFPFKTREVLLLTWLDNPYFGYDDVLLTR